MLRLAGRPCRCPVVDAQGRGVASASACASVLVGVYGCWRCSIGEFAFLFRGLGFAPKEEKPIVEAMSASSGGGEGEAEGMVGEGSDMLVIGCLFWGGC